MKIFIGGATGATGREVVREAAAVAEVVVHVRPGSEEKYRSQQPQGPSPSVFALAEADALCTAMEGCEAVISCIGTMARRFHTGDTYAVSDIGANRALIEAAKAVGVGHFVLMGSYGTARGPGPYFAAKRQIEANLRDSGLSWTVLRPSALVGNGRGMTALKLFGVVGVLPGLRGVVLDAKAIDVQVCARAMVRVAMQGSHREQVLFGREIWALGD